MEYRGGIAKRWVANAWNTGYHLQILLEVNIFANTATIFLENISVLLLWAIALAVARTTARNMSQKMKKATQNVNTVAVRPVTTREENFVSNI